MIDHPQTVLSAIIPSRRDLLLTAMNQLLPDHFRDSTLRNIFLLLGRYYELTGEIMTAQALEDLLRRQEVELSKILVYVETFSALANRSTQDHEFRYSIDALKDLRALQLTGEAITDSMEILERGKEVDRVVKKGHTDARNFLYSQLAAIDRLTGSAAQAPEGDIRHDRVEVLREYADRKSGKLVSGVFTGIAPLDLATFGFQNGELVLICAYTSQGKTTFCSQLAWQACMDGRNVFFVTSETLRAQVRRKILARHSRLPHFDLPDGINSTEIKSAKLEPDIEKKFEDVLDDFTNNPTYGKLYLAQIPRGGSLGLIESRLNRAQQNWNIDLVIVDSLNLIASDRHRAKAQEEYNDVLKGAKVMAATFDDGRGVPIVSPWQMSANAFKEAIRTGEYQLASLAETSEAEKSSDIIMSLLQLPDMPSEVKAQLLKLRDGEKPPPFQLEVDFGTAYLDVKRAASAVSGLLDDDD